ncbi:MAG TPA: hypothetical protein VFQ35_07595 [Polyangiaceae bacterium]|nr:hypothetical protein [Polyangiaceae bacterium]
MNRAAFALLLAGCTPAVAPRGFGTSPVAECDYVVHVESSRPVRLGVSATCRGRAVQGLESSDSRVASAIGSVTSDRGETVRDGDSFLLRTPAREVTFRYRIDLDALAEGHHRALARRSGESLLAPTSSYLMYPWPLDVGIPVRVRFEAPPELAVSSGLEREGDHYRLEAHEIPVATYSAFGKLARDVVPIDDAREELDVTVLDGELAVNEQRITRWAAERARAVSAFYRGFPAARASLFVVPVPNRREVVFGNLLPESSPAAVLEVGSLTNDAALDDDWVLVHELFHIGVPSFHGEGKWFDEGLATYFEPIIRVRSGLLEPLNAWREFALTMPRAERALTRDGLEQSDDIYWAGAIFCLLADVTAREQSQGRQGLEDGLRKVRAAGGNASEVWPLKKTLEIADSAFAQPVLVPLWKRYARKPAPLDLAALFEALGVTRDGSGVHLSDAAPRAWVRRSIFEPGAAISASR